MNKLEKQIQSKKLCTIKRKKKQSKSLNERRTDNVPVNLLCPGYFEEEEVAVGKELQSQHLTQVQCLEVLAQIHH